MVATWQEMSQDCLKAAKKLLDEELFRRSISSSYYAAYAAVTAELVAKGVSFAHGWNNPAHEQLPELVMNNLNLPRKSKHELRKALLILRPSRENADYRPQVSIDRRLALESVVLAQSVIRILEERHGGTR